MRRLAEPARPARRVGALRLALTLAACVVLAAPPSRAASVVAPTAVVAADNAVASQIGIDILQAGGNAVDAAVAVGLALGVVNPFASGLGGGGFLIFRDAGTGEVAVLDFRETAPAASTSDMYLVDGVADGALSRTGGLAVGVPGEAAGWWAAHARFGALPWADVVTPAIALADGFEAGTLLEARLESLSDIESHPALHDAFSVDGHLVRAGERLERRALAETLRSYAEHGPDGFYRGPVADDIVLAVQGAGGILTHEDLSSYAVRWLAPVRSTYRGFDIIGMPAPSSGGLVVAQILNTLSRFELGRGSYDDDVTAHIIAQAFAHAFADRAIHLGDPDFWPIPVDRFLGAARADEAAANYDPTRTHSPDTYGPLRAAAPDAGTSHFSIVDAAGNAVACTVTVNTSFGSKVYAVGSGVVLNNEMDDFAAQPGVPNAFGLVGGEANAIAPGKRPLSSMSPTIVLRDDEVVGALGGSGGPMIITETVLGLVQLIDFHRDAEEAVSAPRFHFQWLPDMVFVEPRDDTPWADGFAQRGYEVVERTFWSALQVVWTHPDGWQAASDPRKHGAPAGY